MGDGGRCLGRAVFSQVHPRQVHGGEALSYFTEYDALPIIKLDRGIDAFSPDDNVPEGFYPDAENMDLRRKTPHTIDGTVPLTQSPPPDGGNIIWGDVYRTAVADEVVLATDKGTLYTYTPATDSYRQLRTGLATNPRYYTSAPFRTQRVITNGIDVPIRYDGSLAHPLGGKVISTFEDGWIGGAGVIADLDKQHARQDEAGLRVTTREAGTVSVTLTPSTALDMLSGLDGGPAFAGDDVIRLQIFVPDATAFAGASNIKFQTAQTQLNYCSIHFYNAAQDFESASKFIPSATFNLSQAKLILFKTGSPTGNLTVKIMTDAANAPSNTPVSGGTSVTVSETLLAPAAGGLGQNVTFNFPSLPTLTAGTTYWVVLTSDRPINTTDFVMWVRTGTADAGGPSAFAESFNTGGAPTIWTTDVIQRPIFTLFGSDGALELRFYSNVTPISYFVASAAGFQQGWNTVAIKQSD